MYTSSHRKINGGVNGYIFIRIKRFFLCSWKAMCLHPWTGSGSAGDLLILPMPKVCCLLSMKIEWWWCRFVMIWYLVKHSTVADYHGHSPLFSGIVAGDISAILDAVWGICYRFDIEPKSFGGDYPPHLSHLLAFSPSSYESFACLRVSIVNVWECLTFWDVIVLV